MIGGSHKPTNFPWLRSTESGGDLVATVGGFTQDFEAAVALNIGDAVYVSGEGSDGNPQVSKIATLADYALVGVGIVVGGRQVSGGDNESQNVIQYDESSGLDALDDYVGTLAANAGDQVIVCILGVALATVDGAVTCGAALTASATTAGQVSPTGAAAGNVLGIALDTLAATGVIPMLVRHS